MAASPARALVIGGGLAGLTAAIALRRAGVEVEIVERGDLSPSSGSGITLMGPALRVLADLGLLDACLRRGAGVDELVTCDAAGQVLNVATLQPVLGPGHPALAGMLRSDLHELLVAATRRAGVPIRTATTVDRFAQDREGVDVAFSDGQARRYDVVVAADGWRSAARTALLGADAPAPQFLGQAVWRAVVPRPTGADATTFLYGPRRKAGFTPISAGEMYAYVVEPAADRATPAPAEQPRMMRELLAEFGGAVAQARGAIVDPSQVDVRALHKLIVPPPWSRGRVVLIGDAVHTTTPQLAMGGAIAMEDGVVLAQMLASGESVPEVLVAFTHRRFERCRIAVESSSQLSEWEKSAAEHGAAAARLIDESMRILAQPA